MKIKTISVTYGRKINLGNYNSAHIEEAIWADLEEFDDEGEASDALFEMAKNSVKEQSFVVLRKKQELIDEIKTGLPDWWLEKNKEI